MRFPGQELPTIDFYIEGLIKDFDPDVPANRASEKRGLDFNREFSY